MKQKHNITVDGLGIEISTGTIAKQASGAVTLALGETELLVAATAASTRRPGQDWFPLTVDYREKFAAAGRFPGGYFKREGRPSEREILTSRLCDRPLRPLFPKGFMNEVQVIGILLATDKVNDPDVLMVNGASASLMVSDIPWDGPVGCVRVGQIDGEFVVNPTFEQRYESDLDLIYVGSETKMLMIEGAAMQIPEKRFCEALEFGQEQSLKMIQAQKELSALCAQEKADFEKVIVDEKVLEICTNVAAERLGDVMFTDSKKDRDVAVKALKEDAKVAVDEGVGTDDTDANAININLAFEELQESIYRKNILDLGKRVDGRAPADLRQISCDTNVLPRVHGSGLFARGETQALVLATLGTSRDVQDMDGLSGGATSKSFILHYNFPPYSVGEAGRFGFTSRREIGHGALAERSLLPVIPHEEEFPYAIRLVSEVMESNGSTSMASICGGCLALMDAGVPILAPVAGISAGLVSEADEDGNITKYAILTDILGAEDHFGDMDFKIAGTREGITGFQLDLKIQGLPFNVAFEAVKQATEARHKILDRMAEHLPESRKDINKNAPRIHTIQIDPEKIGALIGPGGKNIRRITETTGANIDIDDDNTGRVRVYTDNQEALTLAIREIELVVGDIEVGKIYRGIVRGVKDFGAFVECLPGKEGLVHISELADFRVNKTEDVCKLGDELVVKCIGIDDKGRVKLSRRAALEDIEEAQGDTDASTDDGDEASDEKSEGAPAES
ncbi:MAG: polyribonucleotide nucleotidyltransferase [Opitutae bacterium]|jgi:polyribonucleotide nucleotidyltransferase|nr:polyribonucleotide nucleotidyltransferase [Opitutae bacterium]MBT5691590.1 polyribonucleotide nucleotidyltransferase [Opitutae bacterium]MBT6463074.1 polyribonucleotide nucleotidyltransferase [Opitutae bacterium]MBT7854123.1 polyribonucleotide nucleotidyltransferase [Opitutae bacterium]